MKHIKRIEESLWYEDGAHPVIIYTIVNENDYTSKTINKDTGKLKQYVKKTGENYFIITFYKHFIDIKKEVIRWGRSYTVSFDHFENNKLTTSFRNNFKGIKIFKDI